MREIIEELRSGLAASKVDPIEVAKLVADLLPRTISFNNINDTGYVSGNVLAWWVAEETVVFKAGLPGAQALYNLDALHTVLPTTARIGIRKRKGATLGYLRFDIGAESAVAEFAADATIQAGQSVEFFVESLPGVASITVAVPHYLLDTSGEV